MFPAKPLDVDGTLISCDCLDDNPHRAGEADSTAPDGGNDTGKKKEEINKEHAGSDFHLSRH